MDQKHVELLAPAGSYECFIAAVNAGADAVYLGLDRFGARASAVNFSIDELKEALDAAHIRNRKIYLTVNTLFKDSEIDELYDLLYEPYIWGLDGVIVQDIGVMSALVRMFPDLPIHVSTQAAITGREGIEYLKDLGIVRVVPARELSLDEIRSIADSSGVRIECFIHGSLCYSYSGKCLMSSFIGGRSGNRGRCAQPSRLSYNDRYLLSLKDLCVIDIIPQLIEAGISSFKIEGRMKNSDYVHSVTSIYRKYIDMYLAGRKYIIDPDDKRKLLSSYTRGGNCEGYYNCHNGRHMITEGSPSYASENDTSINMEKAVYPVAVKVKCDISKDTEAVITVYDDNDSVTVRTGIVPETAKNHMLSDGSIRKQIVRSGGSGFDIIDCDITFDEGLFLPNGKLNEIRRLGLEAFGRLISLRHHRNDASQRLIINERSGTEDNTKCPVVNASVLNKEQFEAALFTGADSVTIPMSCLDADRINDLDLRGKKLYIALPYVIREEGKANSTKSVTAYISECMKSGKVSGFYVSNLESVSILKQAGYEGEIKADLHVYAYNTLAYEYFREHGITGTTVPVELNEKELIRRGITGEELIIYGRLPMMISANCVYNTMNECRQDLNGHGLYIEDRKKEKLFIECRCSECTNVIYNSVRLCITDESRLFDRIRPSSVRFAFTDESGHQVRSILERYLAARCPNGATCENITDKYTRGHIRRGIE